MQAAFLVHVSFKEGTRIEDLIGDIRNAVLLDLDNETDNCIEALELDPNSTTVYDPNIGNVVVYQP